jgi:hypothetical protein
MVGFGVPEEGDAVFSFVCWVVAEVKLVHELAVEEMVGRGVGVGRIEAPAWFAFGVGAYDGEGEVGLQLVYVTDEVYAVGERAEEAWVGWLVMGMEMG